MEPLQSIDKKITYGTHLYKCNDQQKTTRCWLIDNRVNKTQNHTSCQGVTKTQNHMHTEILTCYIRFPFSTVDPIRQINGYRKIPSRHQVISPFPHAKCENNQTSNKLKLRQKSSRVRSPKPNRSIITIELTFNLMLNTSSDQQSYSVI